MGLSLIGMAAAEVGLLPPAVGALAQEAIDIVAIALALRALPPILRLHNMKEEESAFSLMPTAVPPAT
ncbi:hypothetical protein GCM10009682_03610 [Luedemannella flava]|uniref:Uncharacterized protein n=2 Tax=Luedemannella flava TaxID=349316 RepID=A0ABN2LDI8_9ACTN